MDEKQTEICLVKLTARLENIVGDDKEFRRENSEAHDRILIQLVRMNGTVASLNRWRYLLTGSFAVINVIVVPILLWLIYLHMK